ncbi:hypothetical protein [Pseudooceanicola atlanticus]|uniref:hypothetical protein n=1 Tax=Pseudooceanicola atlanticus TaxID=1461694 RepID=UPI00235225EC|nr:hypothetical protein [Pseudooceanicola atlanticus]
MSRIPYTIFDNDTGQILRTGTTQKEALRDLLQTPAERAILGQSNPRTDYVADGKVTTRPTMQASLLPGGAWVLDQAPPAGTKAQIDSLYFAGEIEVTARAMALETPQACRVRIAPPWPWKDLEFTTPKGPREAPAGAQIIRDDAERMRRAVAADLYRIADDMVAEALGHPDDKTRARWLLKRTLHDKARAGTLTAADQAALAEEVRFSGVAIEDHLDAIGAKIDRENQITLRADGLRSEAERRLDKATTSAGIRAVIAWVEAQTEKEIR